MTDSIEALLIKNELPPVLLIFGEEEFLIEEAYKKILAYTGKFEAAEFNIDILDPADSNINNAIDIASSYPFMAKKRTVIIKNFQNFFSGKISKISAENHIFSKYLNSPQPDTFLLLLASLESLNGISNDLKNPKKSAKARQKIESAKYPFNLLLTKHQWFEFPRIYDSQMPAWVIHRVKSTGKDITADAAELLVAQCSHSLRDLSNEIDKLLIYSGEKKKIFHEDVNFIACASRVYNIFELQKAIGAGNLAQSLKILTNMLSAEHQEMLIIIMLTRYFSTLWKIYEARSKTSDKYILAEAAGVNVFFVDDYLVPLKLYSPEMLNNSFKAMKDADYALKTTGHNNLYIMQNMLIRIIEGV